MSPANFLTWIRLFAFITMMTTYGCSTMKTTNTARSSTEQMLVSNAVDQSLDKIDFQPFAGHAVFLEEKYVDCVDKAYLIASIRHRLLHVGSRLVDKADDAEIVLEPRAGTIGTTNTDAFIGIPEITLPGMLTLPEIRMATRTRQVGVAKIGLAAYDPKTRSTLGEGGVTLAKSDDTNTSILGIGPFQSGTIRDEITQSTTGPAAFTRDRLPVQVAFQTPTPAAIPATPPSAKQVQFTSTEDAPAADAAPVAPAATDAPGWSN